jgi:hypothetical protein
MSGCSTIKIQLNEKIYKIFKPRGYAELKTEFKGRFKLREQAFEIFYLDNQKVEITIESEDDYEVSNAEDPPISKFYMKTTGVALNNENDNSVLTRNLISNYGNMLDSSMMDKNMNDLQSIVENNEIPCYECFDDDELDRTVLKNSRPKLCSKCDGSGLMEKKAAWMTIMLLIEFKLKKFLVDPLKIFKDSVNQTQVVHENPKIANQSMISEPCIDKYENYSVVSKSQVSAQRFQPQFSAEGKIFMPNNPYSVEVFSKINDSSCSTINNKANPLGFLMNKISLKSQNNSINESMISSRFEQPKIPQNTNEDFEEVKLEFTLPAFDASLIKKNTIEIKIFVENNKKEDWPENVRIIGKPGCKLTQDINHPLKQRLKAASRIGVRFTHEINEKDINKDGTNLLEFQFTATDNSRKIKYTAFFSIPLQVDKKKSKLWLCNYIS